MATASMSSFLRRLTRGMAAATFRDQSDRQLVEQLLVGRDEAVFDVIMRRHGPMVYRVCWRILLQEQDTEDAFQATFLILAQKLSTVRQHASLASWLHGVAHRVALKARAQAATRRSCELKALTEKLPPDEVTWGELRSALDGELQQLPEKWRQPLILCYLEGRTQDEAATQLGWSERTLRRRLEEAREALGRRLIRRGVVWPAALTAVLFSDSVAPAAMKLGLIGSTVESAAPILAGQATTGVASAKVAALAEGVVKAMFMTKLKIATAVLLVAGIVSAGVVAVGFPVLATEQSPPPKTEKGIPQEGKNAGEDTAQKDMEKLQGSWKVMSYDAAGKPLLGDGRPEQLVFSKDKVVFKNDVQDAEVSYRLDVSKKPRQIDMTLTVDGEKMTLPGIYHLEGDTLKLCFATSVEKQPPGDRPKEFKTTADTGLGVILATLKREK